MLLNAAVAAPARRVRLALVGNPNSGKTTLFNALCGIRAKTSNYPGTTTAIRAGSSAAHDGALLDVLDLPGVYQLDGEELESRLASDVITGSTPGADVVGVVVDSTNLARNLIVAGQVLAERRPVVVALNMMDVARRRRIDIDRDALAQLLGCPVVPIVATRGEGIDVLRAVVERTAIISGTRPRDLPSKGDTLEGFARWAEQVAARTSAAPLPSTADLVTERLDHFFTHRWFGPAAFIAVMGSLFFTLFTLAAVPMGLIEGLFNVAASWLSATLPAGPVRELITNGVIGGLSGTIVFLPQICILFFLISLLEDTGYLARAAFVVDRVLSRFGLPGQAFVPLLTAHACAVPAIMSTRLIPHRRDRLVSILIAPFMSCSARLPVYVLLTSLLFADPVTAAVAFAGCYLLGAAAALLTATLFSRTAFKGRPLPMVLELPPYRLPSIRNAMLNAKDQGVSFLKSAGSIIMAICIVMWWLSAYPRSGVASDAPARIQQEASYAGRLGHAMQPVFEPLGFDWQLTMGVMTSFVAREVFVSTMSVLEGAAADTPLTSGVVDRIRGMTRADGSVLFTPSVAAAALIFFVLAMQCLPTLTVTRKETGSWKYAGLQLAYMSGLAYAVAFAVRAGLRLMGVS